VGVTIADDKKLCHWRRGLFGGGTRVKQAVTELTTATLVRWQIADRSGHSE